ncbi:MAG: hypothetical protein IIB02_08270 [Thaumarchaeota archaeon]|nr:hypothetical protein [Nitrososphaerota archaeon]
MKQRSLLLFENSIKSKATMIEYLKNLNRFKDFYKLKDYDSILGIPNKKLQEMIEDYVMDMKTRVSLIRFLPEFTHSRHFLRLMMLISNGER